MSRRIERPPREQLLSLYTQEGATLSSLAKHFNTSQPTIRGWMIDYKIERKPHHQASKEANNRNRNSVNITKEELQKDVDVLSVDKIEQKYHVGQDTIYQWIKDLDIVIPPHSKKCYWAWKHKRDNDVDSVKHNYDKTKNISVTSNLVGKSYSYCRRILHENDIPITYGRVTQGHRYLLDRLDERKIPYKVNDRSLINPHELDIVIEGRLAIEYCGTFWHSETFGKKDKDYHVNKVDRVEAKNMRLLTVFDHYDSDIVMSMIMNILGESEKKYARKTQLKQLSYQEISQFERDNHLMGSRQANLYYGLFDGSDLIQTISFGKSRFNTNYQYEIIRSTTKKNTVCVGGLSKLITHFISTNNPESIISYCDRTYGNGASYHNTPLKYSHTTKPNYWYFHKNIANSVHSRVEFQKHKLVEKLATFDPNLTEYQNMINNGWGRYWDCGNKVFVYKKQQDQG